MTDADPYRALENLLAKPRKVQRHLLRLSVWCEWNKCTPVRVFDLREGLLIQCRSDADVSDMIETYPHLDRWSRRKAFFAEEWLTQPDEARAESTLQIVCDCKQTVPRSIDVGKMLSLVPAIGDASNATVDMVSG